jgi:RimJ/RimL family protein N-acetyltransferase
MMENLSVQCRPVRLCGRFFCLCGCVIRRRAIAENKETEIAYALMPQFRGRGLATEIARALRDIGFTRLGLTNMIAFTLTDNRASRRVMEKISLGFERAFDCRSLTHVLYRIVGEVRGDCEPAPLLSGP